MDEESAQARRKRRMKHRRKEPSPFQLWLHGKGLRRSILAIMVLTAGVYATVMVQPLFEARERLGLVRLGMSMGEVHYALGAPAERGAQDSLWTYRKDGRIEELRFDRSGKVEKVSCAIPGEALEFCPSTLGLGVGSSEDAIVRRLGSPDQAKFAGNHKQLTYDGIGLEFDLVGGETRSLSLSRTNGKASLLRHAVWMLVP